MPKDDDRPRRSWRDIDKMRAGGSRGPTNPRVERESDRHQKQYRAALEEAFAKGELGKLAEKLGQPRTPQAQPAAPAEPPSQEHAAEAGRTPVPAGEPQLPPMKRRLDDQLTMRRKLVESVGRQEITRAADRYLERFPLPDDHEFLEQVLEHEKEERVSQAMERIGKLLDRKQTPRRSRALCSKLRYLAETSQSEELQGTARTLLKRLT